MRNGDSKIKTGSFRDVLGGSKPIDPPVTDKCINVVKDAGIHSRLDKCWIAANEGLVANRNWLHQWFDDLKLWEDNGDSHVRLAWITIEGLLTLEEIWKLSSL
uniref:Nucleotide-binding alpha-beta plait domain-containing protein n=1 Tax=Tanacetum cinerariifolium TaxID=118510 RepID=A0A699U0H4_TANCI|nr:nucleotide-binding alpha-beta plait domain-containing protein [Tanacetum cinerariifolium]